MKYNKIEYDVIVIGGGASGMMAAIVAAEQGASVLLLEKNKKLGRKLSITGGGRCNILNAEEDTRLLLANYGSSDKFLFSAFSRYSMQDTRNFFESRGLPIKVEAKKRAFPNTEKAQDVVDFLQNELQKQKVEIRTETTVQSFYSSNGAINYLQVDGKRLNANRYILATGGTSRPETGATGDGFKWLKSMGHTVRQPTPDITPLSVKDRWVREIAGVSVRSITATFSLDEKPVFKVRGDILFTHFGVSGPTILNSASRVSKLLEKGTVQLNIDCFPLLNEKQLDEQVIAILQLHKTKQLRNTLRFIVPAGMTKAFLALLPAVNLETTNSELSRLERLKIVALCKALPLNINSLMGLERAVVADGGVDLREIITSTMRSKKIDNLYITGDLLDISRPTGGFSLQLCWTSGYIAGLNAAKN